LPAPWASRNIPFGSCLGESIRNSFINLLEEEMRKVQSHILTDETVDEDILKLYAVVNAVIKRIPKQTPQDRIGVYCETDHAAARRRAEPGLVWAYRKILEISRPMLRRQLAGYEQYRKLGWLAPLLDKMLSVATLETLGLAVVGDPDHVLRRLAALQASGLDRVSLIVGGGDLGVADTLRCVELLAERVLPGLANDTPIAIEVAHA